MINRNRHTNRMPVAEMWEIVWYNGTPPFTANSTHFQFWGPILIDFSILDMFAVYFSPFFGGVEDLKNAIMCCCSFDEHFWLQWWEQMHRCELWAVRSFQVNCNETLFKTIHSLNGIFWFACVFLFLLFSQFLNWKLSTYLQANQDKKVYVFSIVSKYWCLSALLLIRFQFDQIKTLSYPILCLFFLHRQKVQQFK